MSVRRDGPNSLAVVLVVACLVFVYLQSQRGSYQRQAERQYNASIQAGRTSANKGHRIAVPIGTDVATQMHGKCIETVQKFDNKTVVIHFTDGTRGTIVAGSTYHSSAELNCEIVEIR